VVIIIDFIRVKQTSMADIFPKSFKPKHVGFGAHANRFVASSGVPTFEPKPDQLGPGLYFKDEMQRRED
jgi:hypothetical protein